MDKFTLQSLPIEILLRILSALNRRDLLHFASTCKTFQRIISRDYSTIPNLTFGSLHYNYGRWRCARKWPRTQTVTMTLEEVNLVKKWKFLRFQESEFAFGSHPNPHALLSSVSHVWENNYLCLNSENLGPTKDFARLVVTSGVADLIVNGLMNFLPQLLSGNCRELLFHDRFYDPSIELYSAEIAEFLLRPSRNLVANSLTIHTNNAPSRENCDRIRDVAKEKFLATNEPLNFFFKWTFNGASYPETVHNIRNERTHQILRISMNSNRFSLIAK